MEVWKRALESNGLRINVERTKIIICEKVTLEGKFPCAVCKKGAGNNFILSEFCRC